MIVWRYTAVPMGSDSSSPVRGLVPACGESDVRAKLRLAGLQAVRIERASRSSELAESGHRRFSTLVTLLVDRVRARRMTRRAELVDAIATMLSAGVPLVEALQTAGRGNRVGSLAHTLSSISHAISEGSPLGTAMARHRTWFDTVECAMVEAGQASGDLVGSLKAMTMRLERKAAIGARLTAVLAYPMLVATVGAGVVVFLGSHTLPQLASVLVDSGVRVPRLTRVIMWVGSAAASWGWLLVPGVLILLGLLCGPLRRSVLLLELTDSLRPRLARTVRVASAARTLADLLGSGVPLVEALRITSRVVGTGLGQQLDEAAQRIEQGNDIGTAFAGSRWFDAETIRVLELAQTAGDLGRALTHLADRAERRADRAIAALAGVLEPALILGLAALVGSVVMAAVLPLLRLQEVL